MEPRYFTGQSIMGAVAAHHCTTFKSLVDQLIMVPQVLPVKYATYHALKAEVLKYDKDRKNPAYKAAKEAADRAKEVPYLTPAVFCQSPSPRDTEHATHCNLVCVDLDDGAAPFLSNPEQLARQLDPWSYVAYTTASSTPQVPRMRLIVSAEGIPKEDYAAAVRTVAARIGLTHITPESLKPPQPMYLPSVFSDQGESEHPVFSHRTSGTAFSVHDIEDVAGAASGNSAPRQQRAPASGGDILDYLRAPVPEVTITIATEALHKLDADMPRPQWLEQCAALRHQFDDTDQEDEAYEAFDSWSASGSKYVGPSDTLAAWKSFRTTPPGRVPVTIRSLLHYAVQAGWDSGKTKAGVFERVKTWIADEARTVTELSSDGLRHIAAAPLLSSAEEDMLIQQICRRLRLLGSTASPSALRKDLRTIREQLKAKGRKEDPAALPWALGWVYITAHDEFFRHRTQEKVKPPAFDRAFSRWLLPSEKELIAAGIPVSQAALSRPLILPSAYLTNTIKVETAYGYDYNPTKPGEIIFEDKGRKFVNTYVRNHPEPDPAGSEEAGRVLLGHLEHLIAEPEIRTTLVDFMAFCVQKPGEKIRWAPLIQSEEGAGKTVLFEFLGAALGKAHARCIEGSALFKGYSEWAVGSMLVAIEEVRIAGDNRFAVMNVLKPIITNKWINIEQRYEDSRERENRTNYMLFTNFHDALALKPGDRRYFVVKSRLQNIDQVLALGGSTYFDPIYAMINENAGGIRHFLENWKISKSFNPDSHAPRTTYRDQLINDSAAEATATVRQLIVESESCLLQKDMISSKVLYDLMRGEGMTRLTHQGLGKVLLDEGYVHAGRWLLGGTQQNIWTHNSTGWTEDRARETAFERAELAELGPGAWMLI